MENDLITPKTNPNHEIVGHYFGGYSYDTEKIEIYFCDSYKPRMGYWLTNVNKPQDRKNVSEMAIGRTFYEAHDHGDHWMVSQWWERISK